MKQYMLLCLMFLVACEQPHLPAPPRLGQMLPSAGSGRQEVVQYYTISLENLPPDAKKEDRKNFYVIFDGSGSMKEEIDEAKEGFLEFLKNLPDDINLGLLIFDARRMREVVPLGSGNRDHVRKEVLAISPSNGTPLGEAIQVANTKLLDQYRRQIGLGNFGIVIVTDGEADDSDLMVKNAVEAEKYGFQIYTIGFGIEGHSLKGYSMVYMVANNKQQLANALQEMIVEPPDSWMPSN